ncbi:MAG: sensor protein fixL [Chthoniobacteraceae bacterium]|nr:sensor protein fixL [Chthoniobacteraceae bacterium]
MHPIAIKVLLVEDNTDYAETLQKCLECKRTFSATRAKSLSEAMAILAEKTFDVVLLDLSLPDSSGLETIQAVRGVSPELPIVVLTGTEDESLGLEAVQLGVQDYLVKGETEARQIARAIRYSIERKLAENEIRKLNAVLSQRVMERTEALIALGEESAARQCLEREILQICEREQCRLGQDLHDGLSQQLAGLSMLGKVLADKLAAEAHSLADSALALANCTSKTIATARGLARGLYPVELSRYGLLIALEDLTQTVSEQFNISCELEQDGLGFCFEKDAEIHVYRIVQESISNAIRHGMAGRIRVQCESGEQSHTISVTDNGIGFNRPNAERVPSGMGLHLMNYRARLVGARFEVEKPMRGGCKVTVSFPTNPVIQDAIT